MVLLQNPHGNPICISILPIPIGSMVLLYMVCHGSHQYTPVMLAYILYMDPMAIENHHAM